MVDVGRAVGVQIKKLDGEKDSYREEKEELKAEVLAKAEHMEQLRAEIQMLRRKSESLMFFFHSLRFSQSLSSLTFLLPLPLSHSLSCCDFALAYAAGHAYAPMPAH